MKFRIYKPDGESIEETLPPELTEYIINSYNFNVYYLTPNTSNLIEWIGLNYGSAMHKEYEHLKHKWINDKIERLLE